MFRLGLDIFTILIICEHACNQLINLRGSLFGFPKCALLWSVPVVLEAQSEEEEAKSQQDATGEQRPHHGS